MHLQIKPYHNNIFPVAGILIKGNRVQQWLQQLQHLQVNLEQTPVYGIPGNTANSIWGCFVPLSEVAWKGISLEANEACQLVHQNLYIPQYATIYPMLNAVEIVSLFSTPHLLHPEFGLLTLNTPLNWSALLALPDAHDLSITVPMDDIFIPKEIKRIEIRTLSPEEVIKAMEENAFPQTESFNDKPLNWIEKIKRHLLKAFFSPIKTDEGKLKGEKTKLTKWLEKLTPNNPKWVQKLQHNLEELERRNQSEMDKLMDLFKNNPEEALKYAIPLDGDGTGRGDNYGKFELSKMRNSFDLFGRRNSSGGSAIFGDDAFQRLQQQYYKTAQSLVEQKDYSKAAFVYMKLLKNNHLAAETLENGKMYPEAASVYLKYLQNKEKAAECYEKGQMITDAIELYKELNQNEKVGDLYMTQQKTESAFHHYQIIADEYESGNKYVKASLIYKNKMNKTEPAQELLLKGWRSDRDSFNCINNYFGNITDKKLLLQSIQDIYENDTDDNNKSVFLTALKYELKKDEAITNSVTEMAYEIVSQLAATQPDIVSELKSFNVDSHLAKDILRYKAFRRNN